MVVYKITNKLNEKVYIGKTLKSKSEFLRSSYYGGGKIIGEATKKYGRENFKREILEECNSDDLLNERETYWIKYYNSFSPNGYNITKGGDGFKVEEFTSEHKKRLSESHMGQPSYWKGKKLSQETKNKIAIKKCGQKHTEETKQKMSQSHMGRVA